MNTKCEEFFKATDFFPFRVDPVRSEENIYSTK